MLVYGDLIGGGCQFAREGAAAKKNKQRTPMWIVRQNRTHPDRSDWSGS